MRRILDGLYLGAGYAAGFFLVVVFALMMIMSVGRQFGLNIPSGDDFAAWSMAAMSFLGLAHTFKHGEMIRVELVIDRFSGKARRAIEIISLIAGLICVAYFTWYAVRFNYDTYRFQEMSTGVVALPLWIPQLGYTSGLVLLSVAFVDELIHVLSGNMPTYHKEPPKTAEEVIERAMSSAV